MHYREDREHALSEWDLGPGRRGVPLLLRATRTRDAKLTMEMRSGDGELYDLRADPLETRNLFHDSSSAALRSRLERLIQQRPPAILESELRYTGVA